MTAPNLRWVEPQSVDVSPAIRDLVAGPGFLAEAIVRRGLSNPERLKTFLDPKLYIPAPPTDLPDLAIAADRLNAAIQNGEHIGVWGDFDVDGQTATTILVQMLRILGAKVSYYIPVRGQESHGVALPSLQNFLKQGIHLVLTCDTGISAHDAVRFAASQQVDFIITDHHTLPVELPSAAAVVNPQRLPAGHALSTLCGAGCAYKLVEACFARAGRQAEATQFLDLVALGTIADLASLGGDNRWLVQTGLELLRQSPRPAFQAMFELADIDYTQITEEQISFSLAPRLNALGRLADANPAIPFLLSEKLSEARGMAAQLEALNARRKLLCDQVFQAAQSQIERDRTLLEHPVLLLCHPSWPGGVLGIVASRLVELYQRPAILLTTPPGEPARGSARSVASINITQAITAAGQLLIGFGGHPMAAGFALEPSKIPEFQRALDLAILAQIPNETVIGELVIDSYLPMESLTLEFVEAMDRLAPFGPGNPPLVLATRNVSLRNQTVFGKTRDHLQLVVEDASGVSRKVIWWQGAGAPLPEGRFDLAYTVRATNYRGKRSVQVEWLHTRPISESLPLSSRRALQEIQDFRAEIDPQMLLEPFFTQNNTQVYAEGETPFRKKTVDRYHLAPSETLVFWSVPPGRAELQFILDAVLPHQVTWFGVSTSTDQLAPFLTRLSGLVRFALNNHAGQATLPELAAATAQRDVTIRKGLAWLAAQGHITLIEQDPVSVSLTAGGSPDLARSAQLERELAFLLQETTAFRTYCRKVDLQLLLG